MRTNRPNLKRISFLFSALLILTIAFISCTKKQEGDAANQNGKKIWKIAIVKYEDLQQTEDAEKGIREGLTEAGLVEGTDYSINSRSAQGDLPAVLTLIDAAVQEKNDLMISLQTPTLHAAIQRAGSMSIVFMVVANPFVISNIGKNDSTHLENVTGLYTMSTFEKMLGYIKQCLPKAKKIGTLYALPELNAQFYKNSLMEAAQKAGLELEAVGVSSKLEVGDAALGLCDRGIDAICQIEDNLTSATFSSIAKAGLKSKIPVFSFVKGQMKQGSSIVIAPDYYDAAHDCAKIIARVIRGENPGRIPFDRIKKFPVLVNLNAAKACGMRLPEEIVSQASEVMQIK